METFLFLSFFSILSFFCKEELFILAFLNLILILILNLIFLTSISVLSISFIIQILVRKFSQVLLERAPLRWLLCPFNISLLVFEQFLTFCIIACSRFTLHFPWPWPRTVLFSMEPCFFLLEKPRSGCQAILFATEVSLFLALSVHRARKFCFCFKSWLHIDIPNFSPIP